MQALPRAMTPEFLIFPDAGMHERCARAGGCASAKARRVGPKPTARQSTGVFAKDNQRLKDDQRLENWKLRRAFALPYFLRSTTRESRVRKPPFLSAPRRSGS